MFDGEQDAIPVFPIMQKVNQLRAGRFDQKISLDSIFFLSPSAPSPIE